MEAEDLEISVGFSYEEGAHDLDNSIFMEWWSRSLLQRLKRILRDEVEKTWKSQLVWL